MSCSKKQTSKPEFKQLVKCPPNYRHPSQSEGWFCQSTFTDKVIKGKIDRLEGLKESIILGHRIPVGTGTRYYTDLIKKELQKGKTVKEIIELFAHSGKPEADEDDLDQVMDY